MGMEAGKGSQLHAKNCLHEVAKGDVVGQPDGVAHVLEPRDQLLLGFETLEGSPGNANTGASGSERESNWTWWRLPSVKEIQRPRNGRLSKVVLLSPGGWEASKSMEEAVNVKVVVIVQVAEPVFSGGRVEEGGELRLHLAAEGRPTVV